ncbi:MAG: hypothetical protein D6695_01900 [Planctomycetota bacterium]|nr:MAG: hypothetical protein D6695_01900 [Planctomycetota bacterium]
MTPTIAAAAGLFMFATVSGAQPDGPPAGHPSITDPGRQQQPLEPPPPADPADVESIDAIIKAYYESLSGPPGEDRDWDRFKSLFQPQARFIPCRPGQNGKASIWVLAVNDFVEINRTIMIKGGYFEKEVGRRVEQFGNIAHVWSTYEARKSGKEHVPYSRGIYSFQLLKDGDRWWFVTAYWDYERPEAPIPDKYLVTPKQ